MTEQTIFLAALEIGDPAERRAHVLKACGGDQKLRRQVESLLAAHGQSGAFLDVPALEQIGIASPSMAGAESLDMKASEGSSSRGASAGSCAAGSLGRKDSAINDTQAEPTADETDDHALDFLQPTTKPGALGRLGHYEVLEVLGRGGFGTVVRAFDEKLHRMVAIKVMAPQLATTSPARKRFIREARSSAAICHENVVAIHAIEEQPIPFLVMDYVAGETLQQRLDRTGPLDRLNVVRIGVQIANGLAAAHAMGKIHRDIKPANILLENGVERVKITDFGLARAADDASLTQSGVIAGTPLYMAPEQAQGQAIDHRADLFSLGSVLYVMCSGRPPFRAATTLAVLKRVAEDTPRPIHEIIPEVPERLCSIIAKLHAKTPEDRFQTAKDVAEVLGMCLRELQLHGKVQESGVRNQEAGGRRQEAEKNGLLPAPVAATTMIPRAPARRKRFWFAAAAVLLLSIVGLGVTEATGVTNLHGTVIRLFSPNGTLVVEVDDPDVNVTIDGEDFVIKGAGAKEIRIKPGQYQLQASKDGKIVRQDLVTIAKGGRQVVRISREAPSLAKVTVPASTTPDRRAAEYAMSVGATLIIIEEGKERTLWPGNDVPTEAFDIRVASFIGNQLVSDAGMDSFKGCKYLTNLDIENTNLTAGKIWELKNALPGCKIEWDGDIKLLPDSPDRRAAEYVLSIGGLLSIKGGGLYRSANSRSDLPKGTFVVRAATLTQNQSVSDADLALFKGCDRLDAINLSGTKVSDAGLAHLKDCKALLGVDLSDTQVTDVGLADFKDSLTLKRLTLNGTKITDTGLAHLKNHRGLTHLGLNATGITDTGLAHFKDCQSLVHLDLGDTQTSDVGLAYFKDCKSLMRVLLAGTKVTNTGLAHLKDCKSLLHLDLGNTKISNAGLAHLKDCENLAFLELHQTQVGDAGLAYLKDCKNLHHLNLANSQVSDAGLTQLLGYPKLHTLNVKKTQVTQAGLKKFAARLPTCRIECDDGMIEPTVNTDPDRRVVEWLQSTANFHVFVEGKELQVFSHMELPKAPFQLRRLRVSSAKVSDETSPIFKGLRHLTHLEIFNRKVSDASLGHFAECTHLRNLTLHGTGVTDAGLAQLAGFSKLEYVNLNQTAVSEAAVKKLAAALPKCKIEWNGGVISAR